MRVWIGCLACYNEGRLAGEWFNAIDADAINIEDVCHFGTDAAEQGHEEMWVMDLDETFGWLDGECSPHEAQAVAETLESIEAAHDDPEVVLAWADHMGVRSEVIRDRYDGSQEREFADAYRGTYDNWMDYVYNYVEDTAMLHGVDETLANYFDYEAFGRDLRFDHFTERTSNGLAVFLSN